MAGSFLPPVLFEITANATQAMATFNKVNAELAIMEKQALKTGVAISKTTRALTMATAATKALALVTVAFAAYGVKEIMDLEQSYASLGQTLANQGLSTEANRKTAADLAQSYEKLGFDAANAATAFGTLITATGSLEQSQKMLAMSANLARKNNMSLEDASRALVRASAGNAKLFTQFGITLDATKPKAEATAEAMAKLEKRLSGQAQAYTKTFKGQLQVLGKQIENVAEAIGAVLLPVLTAFVSGLSNAGSFLKKHQAILIGVAAVIVGVVTAGVVNLTKKLYLNAAAWAVANWQIVAIVAAITALVAGFVWAWNKFDWFRKGVATGLQQMVKGFGYLVKAAGFVGESILKYFLTPFRLLLMALSHLPKVGKYAQTALDFIDKGLNGIGNVADTASEKIVSFGEDLYGMANKKIDLSKLSLGGIKIPGFENGIPGTDDAVNDAGKVADAMINALQKVADFNTKVADTMKELKDTFVGITTKDYEGAIKEGLLNPVDQLVQKAQKAVDTYQTASNQYTSAMATLTSAQNEYLAAVNGTDKALIASSESAMNRAQAVVDDIQKRMGSGLEAIAGYQDDMINAIIDAYGQISDLEKNRSEVLAGAAADRLAAEGDYLAKMKDLNKSYNENVASARKEAAKREADIIKQSVDQLRNIYKSATTKSIGDIFSSLTFGGLYAKGGTIGKLTDYLKKSFTDAAVLSEDAAKLSGLGFTQTFIEQVVSQGPDVGHKLAQQILTATPESVKDLQTYWNALDKQSNHGVDAVAKTLNSGVVLATEEMTQQLAQVSKDLNEQLAQYAVDLADASASAYSDYQATLDKIKAATDKAIKDIDDQITALNAKIAQLRAALAASMTIGSPGVYQPPTSLAPTIQPIPLAPSGGSFVGPIPLGATRTNSGYTTSTNVTVIANTNASAQSIATDVAWVIKTQGDQQFAVNPKSNKMIPV